LRVSGIGSQLQFSRRLAVVKTTDASKTARVGGVDSHLRHQPQHAKHHSDWQGKPMQACQQDGEEQSDRPCEWHQHQHREAEEDENAI
jgi:hypothetical protein